MSRVPRPAMRIDVAVATLLILCIVQVLAVGFAYGSMRTLMEGMNYRVIRIEQYIDTMRK